MSSVKGVERLVRRQGHVLTIHENASITSAAEKMRQDNIGSLVVVDEREKVVGIITERDLLAKVVAAGKDPNTTEVAEAMSPQVVACHRETSLSEAQLTMSRHKIRHLPIIEDGLPLGMLSSRDVLAYQISTVQAVVQQQAKVLDDAAAWATGHGAMRMPGGIISCDFPRQEEKTLVRGACLSDHSTERESVNRSAPAQTRHSKEERGWANGYWKRSGRVGDRVQGSSWRRLARPSDWAISGDSLTRRTTTAGAPS